MDNPQVSVILPVHNGADTILRSVSSILNQTYEYFEIIIVENGSTDRTASVVRSIDDQRIKFYQLPNPDLVEALNFGILKSQGRYIARMDADDWSYPNRLDWQASLLDENDAIGLVSGLVAFKADIEKNLGYKLYVDWLNQIVTPQQIYTSRFQESALPHPSVMFRKSLGEKYGFYQKGNFPEDFELWNRWLNQGVRMTKVNQLILDWYDLPNRLSRSHTNYSQQNFSNIKAKYFADWFTKKHQTKPPKIYVWGSGRSVRQKVKHLSNYGLTVSKFIDVKETNSESTIHYKELHFSKDLFVLNYVNDRQGKKEVYRYLSENGFKEGVNFYMME